jgi:dTDP-4-amino-4,6-dideoxygalactose transaminase
MAKAPEPPIFGAPLPQESVADGEYGVVKSSDMVVPLVDLKASFQPIRDEVMRAFDVILDGMQLLLGPNTEAFEREFADYCGAFDGVAVSNGTDALFAALSACGVGAGDEVIAPSHTFFATIEAIVHTGAIPVMVDVEPDTLTIDPAEVRKAITPATRAIVPVHLYGHPADMDPILELAREHDLRVIEDAAQAHGAGYRGRRCGSMGDAASFSFYVTKNLAAIGEGGFVTARDAAVAERVRLLRHHGHVSKFEHAIVGRNLRMDELQAAVLRIRLRDFESCLERRRAHARRYDELFANTSVRTLEARPDCAPVHHVYPIRVASRDALVRHLGDHGIGTGIHYPIPAHRQPALEAHTHRRHSMDVTDAACSELVSIPMYPELTGEQIEYVASHVLDFSECGSGSLAGHQAASS